MKLFKNIQPFLADNVTQSKMSFVFSKPLPVKAKQINIMKANIAIIKTMKNCTHTT